MEESENREEELANRKDKSLKKIKKIGKRINRPFKFGTYIEDVYTPPLLKKLNKKFACKCAATNYRMRINDAWYEIDVWGESDDAIYIVEIKSHLRIEAIEQLEEQIRTFANFRPENQEKKKYGMIVATHFKDNIKQKVLDSGFYFFSVTDNIAKISVPADFQPIAR